MRQAFHSATPGQPANYGDPMVGKKLTEGELTQLYDEIRRLTRTFARRLMSAGRAELRTRPYRGYTSAERRSLSLARLRILRLIRAELEAMADAEAWTARSAGANFQELGDAWGISRQGARNRWARLPRSVADGDRVRLTRDNGERWEGIWEDTPEGPALRLDDGTLQRQVVGQMRCDPIEHDEPA